MLALSKDLKGDINLVNNRFKASKDKGNSNAFYKTLGTSVLFRFKLIGMTFLSFSLFPFYTFSLPLLEIPSEELYAYNYATTCTSFPPSPSLYKLLFISLALLLPLLLMPLN